MWSTETQIDIDAPAAPVWRLFTDVGGWPRWNAGVASARLHGPFASGSRFEMQLPGDGPLLRSVLTEVQPGQRFTDETAFEGVVVRVTHVIEPRPSGGVCVRYRTEVEGPGAADIGAAVSADFADVLRALKQHAESDALTTAHNPQPQ